MKKIVSAVTLCALTLAIGGTAFALGCSECNQGTQGVQSLEQPDPLRKFQIDTLDLRQDMMNKRFELQRENLKGLPDVAKITGLKAEISAIQTRINIIRLQSGLTNEGKRDGECFSSDGGCVKKIGGGGCNGQPCGNK